MEKIRQWHEENPELLKKEVDILLPFLAGNDWEPGYEDKTNNFYIDVSLQPLLNLGYDTVYKIRLLYMPEHPSTKYGFAGSIRVYPLENFQEAIRLLVKDGIHVPHILYDNDRKMYYLCTADRSSFKAGKVITSGAVVLRIAIAYILLFHLTFLEGEISPEEWSHDLSIQF